MTALDDDQKSAVNIMDDLRSRNKTYLIAQTEADCNKKQSEPGLFLHNTDRGQQNSPEIQIVNDLDIKGDCEKDEKAIEKVEENNEN